MNFRFGARRAQALVMLAVVATLWFSLASCPRATAADDPPKYSDAIVAKAERILADNGLQRVGRQIQPAVQAEFTRLIAEESRLKRHLRQTRGDWEEAEQATKRIENQFDVLEQQLGVLNAKYAAVGNPGGVNNELVARINAGSAQLKQLAKARDANREVARRRRSALSDEEEAYSEHVLKMRRQVNAMRETVAAASKVRDVQIAFQVLATRYETPDALDGEAMLSPLDRRVRKLEEAIFSEAIPLEEENGGLFVRAVVGLEPVSMLVDSGASLVLIPKVLAEKIDIQPAPDARVLTMVLADGRRIPCKEVLLPRLRVGKFEATDVRAAILDESIPQARPLLGLSFLERYRFEIDSAQRELNLLEVKDGGE